MTPGGMFVGEIAQAKYGTGVFSRGPQRLRALHEMPRRERRLHLRKNMYHLAATEEVFARPAKRSWNPIQMDKQNGGVVGGVVPAQLRVP